MHRPFSRFASLSRRQAVAVLIALVIGFLWFAQGSISQRSQCTIAKPGEPGDVEVYEAIIKRVHDGQNYYEAVGTELRQRNFPTRPFFNWRQPTYAMLLGHLPSLVWGSVIRETVAVSIVSLSFLAFGLRPTWGLITAMSMAFLPITILMQETWSSYFVVLGLILYAYARWRWAMASLLVALAFREFALLPCVVACVMAWHEGRRQEVRAWMVAFIVYAICLALHVHAVSQRLLPTDMARSWISFGGSAFLVGSGSFTPLFLYLPKWAVPIAFPLAVFGLAGWRGPTGTRVALTAAGYFAVFSIIGHQFNHYWGIMYAPLLSIGVGLVPGSVRDLVRSLCRPGGLAQG